MVNNDKSTPGNKRSAAGHAASASLLPVLMVLFSIFPVFSVHISSCAHVQANTWIHREMGHGICTRVNSSSTLSLEHDIPDNCSYFYPHIFRFWQSGNTSANSTYPAANIFTLTNSLLGDIIFNDELHADENENGTYYYWLKGPAALGPGSYSFAFNISILNGTCEVKGSFNITLPVVTFRVDPYSGTTNSILYFKMRFEDPIGLEPDYVWAVIDNTTHYLMKNEKLGGSYRKGVYFYVNTSKIDTYFSPGFHSFYPAVHIDNTTYYGTQEGVFNFFISGTNEDKRDKSDDEAWYEDQCCFIPFLVLVILFLLSIINNIIVAYQRRKRKKKGTLNYPQKSIPGDPYRPSQSGYDERMPVLDRCPKCSEAKLSDYNFCPRCGEQFNPPPSGRDFGRKGIDNRPGKSRGSSGDESVKRTVIKKKYRKQRITDPEKVQRKERSDRERKYQGSWDQRESESSYSICAVCGAKMREDSPACPSCGVEFE